MIEITWWAAYTFLGIWLQDLFSGIDCFGPVLILCLQNGRYKSLFWLALVWILIQEGTGSLPFGSSLLYYGGLAAFFLASRPYLKTGSLPFILFLSILAGLWYVLSIHLFVSLQPIQVDLMQLAGQAARLTMAFPLLWLLVSTIYTWWISPGYARN